MAHQTLTLNIPDDLYSRLEKRAAAAHRTVEAEVLDVVAGAVADEELPADVAEALAALAVADDKTLWQSARSRLSQDVSDEIEELHFKRQREGLTDDEKYRLAGLMRQYERVLAIRAEAMGLLTERGYDVHAQPEHP
ncbi:MAG TPA: hypothetical protein VFU32_04845 [Ktedonobacterales bacterium]|nr:hypothetical protein [Ktedonobacterales bacterium]